MRISKYLFPVLLLFIFFYVIALGWVAGYWETDRGGRHQHSSDIPTEGWTAGWVADSYPVTLAGSFALRDGGGALWQL